tara:strand:- start:328 stop:1824 length:1497 start_codon:yes stop_codon:yes gene_type:complete
MAKSSGKAGSLFFGMTLETKDFKKRLKKARKDLAKVGKEMREDLGKIAAGGVAVGAGLAAAGAGMLIFAKSTAEATNEQLLLADSIGATQSEVAGLDVAAQKFSVSQDMLIDKMREAGGIDAFKDIADQVKNAGDQSDQLAKAQELLGNEGLKLLPILQQGAAGLKAMEQEAIGLGLALSPQQIAESRAAWEEYEDTLLNIQGLGKQLGTSLMEPFALASAGVKSFINTFRADIISGFKFVSDMMTSVIQSGIKSFIEFGIPILVAIESFAISIGQTFSDIFAFITTEGNSTFSTFSDFIQGTIDFVATFKQVFIAGVSTAISTVLQGAFNGLAKFSDFVGGLVSEIAFMLEGLGVEEEGFGHAVTMAFKDQGKSIRDMGKDLAKPFEIAAEDNINEAGKILEKNARKSERLQVKFTKGMSEFAIKWGETTKKAGETAKEVTSQLTGASEKRAGAVLTGSQEEAKILSGQADKNLKVQQETRDAAKKTNQILMNLGTT